MKFIWENVYEFEIELDGVSIGKSRECTEIICENGWHNIIIKGIKQPNKKFKQKIVENWISAFSSAPTYTLNNVIEDVYDINLSFDILFCDEITEIEMSCIDQMPSNCIKNLVKRDILNIERLNSAKKLYFLPTIVLCAFLSIALLAFGINIISLYDYIIGVLVLSIGVLFSFFTLITMRKLLKKFHKIK